MLHRPAGGSGGLALFPQEAQIQKYMEEPCSCCRHGLVSSNGHTEVANIQCLQGKPQRAQSCVSKLFFTLTNVSSSGCELKLHGWFLRTKILGKSLGLYSHFMSQKLMKEEEEEEEEPRAWLPDRPSTAPFPGLFTGQEKGKKRENIKSG